MNVLCFGESLIRLATTAHERLEDASELEVSYAGAESVVAVALARQGETVSYASKVSDNQLGSNALVTLARNGVSTSQVLRSSARMGLYYVERGKSIRPSIVTYDRSGTAMAMASREDFDWDRMLNGVEVFFFSGIVPAISSELVAACHDALRECKGRGIHTVCDLNYRHTMWSPDEALAAWEQLLPMVDVLTASEDDIIALTDAQVSRPDLFDYCQMWCDKVRERYNMSSVAFITRLTNRHDIARFRGTLLKDGETYVSKEQVVSVSDLSSCGSIFTAGIIHGTISRWEPQFIIDYATIASAYKATERGEYSYASETEIARLLANVVTPAILQ